MEVNLLAIGAFGLGALAKLFVPWFIKRRRNPDAEDSAWNWRYLWPQLAAFVVVMLVAPLITDLDAVNMMSPGGAYFAGWGVGDQAKTFILDTGLVSK